MNILPQRIDLQDGGSQRSTAAGGMVLFADVARGIGLTEQAGELLPRGGSGRAYAPEDLLMSTLASLLLGGDSLSDIDRLSDDGLFGRVPSSDTTGRWLKRTGCAAGLSRLRSLHRTSLAAVLGPQPGSYVLDVDDTIIPAGKKRAKRAYNGTRGMMATVGFLAGCDAMVGERLRAGNRKPGSQLDRFVGECLNNLPPSARVEILRSDSAGYSSAVLNLCRARRIGFVIAARRDPAVLRAANSVPADQWRRFIDDDGSTRYVGEAPHSMGKVDGKFRLVFIRDSRSHPSLLFAGDELRCAIATDRDADPLGIVRLYRGRGECENRIKEWKSGLAAGRLPCTRIGPNRAWTRINAIAYNLAILLRRTLWTDRPQMKAIRHRLLRIPGVVVRHARRIALKLAAPLYQALDRMRRTLSLRLASP